LGQLRRLHERSRTEYLQRRKSQHLRNYGWLLVPPLSGRVRADSVWKPGSLHASQPVEWNWPDSARRRPGSLLHRSILSSVKVNKVHTDLHRDRRDILRHRHPTRYGSRTTSTHRVMDAHRGNAGGSRGAVEDLFTTWHVPPRGRNAC